MPIFTKKIIMKVELKRLNKAMHFECSNAEGLTVHTDSSPDAGGVGKGVRPMEMILMAVASCSSIDIVLILEKMRQQLDDIKVEVNGERVDTVPKMFKKIHVTYHLYGEIKEKKAAQAVQMSMEKYCSVSKMLEKSVEITTSFTINDQVPV